MSYGQMFCCYASAIVGVMWLVPLAPFTKLITMPLITAPVPFLDMMYLECSLWDINIIVKCSTRIPVWRDAALWMCDKMTPMYGKHRFAHAHQWACNLEEQSQGLFRFGCDKLAIISYGSKAVAFIWAFAALTQLCAATNSYLFAGMRPKQFDLPYLERFDQERMSRRAVMVTLYVASPILGICGFVMSVFVFELGDMVMPTIVKPPEGLIYPIAWGSAFVLVTCVLSIASCIMCFCTVNDDEPTGSEMGSDGENETLLQQHEDPYGMRWKDQNDPYGQSQQAGGFGNPAASSGGYASGYDADPYASAAPQQQKYAYPSHALGPGYGSY